MTPNKKQIEEALETIKSIRTKKESEGDVSSDVVDMLKDELDVLEYVDHVYSATEEDETPLRLI